MLTRWIQTDDSQARLFQRLVLALVILPHGAQELLGWFGGWGFDGTLAWFEQALHVPAPIAALVVFSDFFGALALAAGVATRLAAFGVIATMVGAVLMVHAPNGFFMNWSGTQAGEGFELHLLAIALAVPLMIKGAGAWSLDGYLSRRTHRPAHHLSSARA